MPALLCCALGAPATAAPLGPDPHGPTRRSAVVEVAERYGPAVVNVFADEVVQTRVRSGGSPGSFFRDMISPRFREEYTTTSLGSGVLVDPRHVVTNHHVIAAGERIRIRLSDRRELACEVVGADPALDIAVLRVHTDRALPHLPLTGSDEAWVGETVIAIGNPFGLGHTVTTGVVSALHRTVEGRGRTYHDVLQTDASINPGNSGGPLLDIQGRLVGLNTAMYGPARGIGFALPASRVRRVAQGLIEHGAPRQGWLGLDVGPLLGEARAGASTPGVVVVHVSEAGPAATAGLAPGDVVETVEGFPATDVAAFGAKVRDFPPGAEVPMSARRAGAPLSVRLIAAQPQPGFARQVLARQLGARCAFRDDREPAEDAHGCRITDIRSGSQAARAGLAVGDLIHRVGDAPARDERTLDEAVEKARRRGTLSLQVRRREQMLRARFDL